MARRTPSRLRKHRLRLPQDELARLAAALIERHREHLSGGYLLTAGAVWRSTRGDFTCRFVYRRRRGTKHATVTYTLRGGAG